MPPLGDVLPPLALMILGAWLILDRHEHARRFVRSQNAWRRRVGARSYGSKEERHNVRAAVIVGACGIGLGVYMVVTGTDF
jgi:hypothetical protein